MLKRKNKYLFFLFVFWIITSVLIANMDASYVLVDDRKIKVSLGERIPSNVVILMKKITKDFPYLVFWGNSFQSIPYIYEDIDSSLKDNPIGDDPKIGSFDTNLILFGEKVKKIKLVSFKGRLVQIILGLKSIKIQDTFHSVPFLNLQTSDNQNVEAEKTKLYKKRFFLYKKLLKKYGSPIFYQIIGNMYPISTVLHYCYPLWIQSGIAITLNLGNKDKCKSDQINKNNTMFSWIAFTYIKLYKDFLKERDDKYREKYYPYRYQKFLQSK